MGRNFLIASCLLALVGVSLPGCRDFGEGAPANVLLEIVGAPPASGAACTAESPVFWLAKAVDGFDRPVFGVVRARAMGSATGPNGACVYHTGSGSNLPASRYRVVATDGDWTAACSQILQLFLPPTGDDFHRIRFTVGQPGCEVSIGP